MENKDRNNRQTNNQSNRPARPVGVRPNAARPHSQGVRQSNRPVNRTQGEIKSDIPKRDNLVDVDAENENYFINSMGYEELVYDDTVRTLEEEDKKQASKQKTPEQLKKRKVIGISAASAGVVLIGGLLVLNVMKSDPGFSIEKVDITGHEPVYIAADTVDSTVNIKSTQPVVEETTGNTVETTDETGEPVTENEVERINRIYTIITPEDGTEYNAGGFITKEFKVNSKPVGSDEYVVSDTKYDCGLEAVYTDDTVNEIIKQYNETNISNKQISIDTETIKDSTFIIARVGCQYPEDYPTSNGRAYEVPDVSLDVVGTYVEESNTSEEASDIEKADTTDNNECSNKVEVNSKIYTLDSPIEVYDKPSDISVATGFNFDYLIQMPSGAKADSYKIIVTINEQKIVYNGVDVN